MVAALETYFQRWRGGEERERRKGRGENEAEVGVAQAIVFFLCLLYQTTKVYCLFSCSATSVSMTTLYPHPHPHPQFLRQGKSHLAHGFRSLSWLWCLGTWSDVEHHPRLPRVVAPGLRVEVWIFLQGCWPEKYPMSKYRVFLPSRVLIPPLIWKVYHSSSLGSGSSLLGPHGENGPVLMCRDQTLVTQQGIPPLLVFFRSVCAFQICSWSLFDLSLPASHSVTWKSNQSDFLVCHYKAFAQDMPSLGSLHPTNGPSWHTPRRHLSDEYSECLEVIRFTFDPSSYSQ